MFDNLAVKIKAPFEQLSSAEQSRVRQLLTDNGLSIKGRIPDRIAWLFTQTDDPSKLDLAALQRDFLKVEGTSIKFAPPASHSTSLVKATDEQWAPKWLHVPEAQVTTKGFKVPRYDSSAKDSQTDGTSSFSHVIGAAAVNRIVFVSATYPSARSISTATFGGTGLTHLSTLTQGSHKLSTYVRVGPATGSNTVVIDLDASAELDVVSVAFQDVHQTTSYRTIETLTGNSTTPAVAVTPIAPGEHIYAVCSMQGNPAGFTMGDADMVEREDTGGDSANDAGMCAASMPVQASTETPTWLEQVISSDNWCAHGISMYPAERVKVMVLDTDLDISAPEIVSARIVQTGGWPKNYTDEPSPSQTWANHGTGVVSQIIASGAADMLGVAPDVDIYFGRMIRESDDDMEPAWFVSAMSDAETEDIDVISMSFGWVADPGSTVADAVKSASDAGILLVVACGNEGSSEPTPANSNFRWPARYAQVIAVSSINYSQTADDNEKRNWFSSYGSVADEIVPWACAPSVDVWWEQSVPSGVAQAHAGGTSLSCPQIAGGLALLFAVDPAFRALKGDAIVADSYYTPNLAPILRNARKRLDEAAEAPHSDYGGNVWELHGPGTINIDTLVHSTTNGTPPTPTAAPVVDVSLSAIVKVASSEQSETRPLQSFDVEVTLTNNHATNKVFAIGGRVVGVQGIDFDMPTGESNPAILGSLFFGWTTLLGWTITSPGAVDGLNPAEILAGSGTLTWTGTWQSTIPTFSVSREIGGRIAGALRQAEIITTPSIIVRGIKTANPFGVGTVDPVQRQDHVGGVGATAGVVGWALGQVTHQGLAVLDGTGSLTAIGTTTVTHVGQVAFAATGSLTATASVTRIGQAAFAATGSLTATASVTRIGQAALDGTGDLAAIGSVTGIGQAAFAATGSLAAIGSTSGTGQAAFAATGSLTATASVTHPGIAVLAATGSLTAISSVTRIGQAAFAATGDLVAAGTVAGTLVGQVAFDATGSLTAIASVTGKGVAAFDATGSLTATASATRKGQVAFGSGEVPFSQQITVSGDDGRRFSNGSFSSTAPAWDAGHNSLYTGAFLRFQLSGVPKGATIANANIELEADGNAAIDICRVTVYASGADDQPAPTTSGEFITALNLRGTGVAWVPPDQTAGDTIRTDADINIDTVVQEVVDRAGWAAGNHILLFIDDLVAEASDLDAYRDYAMEDHGSRAAPILSFDYIGTTMGGWLDATGSISKPGVAVLAASGDLVAVGQRSRPGVAAFIATGNLTATGETAGAHVGQVAFEATGSFTADPALTGKGVAALAGTGSLVAAGGRVQFATATLDATGSLDAIGLRSRVASVLLSAAGDLVAVGQSTGKGAATFAATGNLTAIPTFTHGGVAALAATGSLTADPTLTGAGVVSLDATGSLIATGDVPSEVFIYPDGTTLDVDGWTAVGAASLHETLDEVVGGGAGDNDYNEAPNNATADAFAVSLANPTAAPTVDTGHVLHYRIAKSATGGATVDIEVQLRQGASTVIRAYTHTGISETITQFDQTLLTTEADDITDYDDLRIHVIGDASGGGRRARIYWANLELPGGTIHVGAAVFAATGSLVAVPTRTAKGVVAFDASGDLDAIAATTGKGVATLVASGNLVAASTLSHPGVAALVASGDFTASGQRSQSAFTALSGTGILDAASTLTAKGAVAFVASGSLTADPTLTGKGVVAFVAVGSLTADGAGQKTGIVALDATGTLNATGETALGGTVAFTASGSLTADPTLTAKGATILVASGLLAADSVLSGKGVAALAATGSLVAAGLRLRPGVVAFAASGDLAANGLRSHPGSVAFAATGSLTTDSTLTAKGVAALVASGDLTATGEVAGSLTGQVAFVASGSLSATANTSAKGVVALAATGILDAIGLRFTPGVAVLDATGALAADPTLTAKGVVALDATGILDATGETAGQLTGQVAFAATGNLVADPALTAEGIVALAATGLLAADPAVSREGIVTLAATGSLVADPTGTFKGVVAFVATGDLTATGDVAGALTGQVAFEATGTLTADPALTAKGVVALVAIGDLTATGQRQHPGIVVLAATGSLNAIPILTAKGVAALVASGDLTATGDVAGSLTGQVAFDATGDLNAIGLRTQSGVVALGGTGSLSAIGQLSASAQGALNATGTLVATGSLIKVGQTAFAAIGSLTADATLTAQGQAVLAATGDLVASGSVTGLLQGVVAFAGTGTLVTATQLQTFGDAIMSGAGTLGVTGQRQHPGVAAFDATGNLAAIGLRSRAGAAAFGGTGTLVTSATFNGRGIAVLAGTGSLIVLGNTTAVGIALLNGIGVLSAIPTLAEAIVKANQTMTATLVTSQTLTAPAVVTSQTVEVS